MGKKDLERQILEEELLMPPRRRIPESDGYPVRKPRRSVKDGIRRGFNDLNGVYRAGNRFFEELSHILGNK